MLYDKNVCLLQINLPIMKKLIIVAIFIIYTSISFAQYNNRDGNRIGITGGVSQSALFTSNFSPKQGIGYNGGLSVRGNYYNNWSMIYGMQFFINTFSLPTSLSQNKETIFSLSGVQVRLLLSYNVVKDHVSIDFGPVLQVNGKLSVKSIDENNVITGTTFRANQLLDVSKINGNFYVGFSAGSKTIRGIIYYQYGFTNLLNNLNTDDLLRAQNGNKDFKGTLGTVSAQILFNL